MWLKYLNVQVTYILGYKCELLENRGIAIITPSIIYLPRNCCVLFN
jgi:hypothetical protein